MGVFSSDVKYFLDLLDSCRRVRRKPNGINQILGKLSELRTLGHPRRNRALARHSRLGNVQAEEDGNMI
eukprot:2204266-Pyramimonas_sp.AAC.2